MELCLPAGAAVDILALAGGEPNPALVRGELLEGVDPGAGAEFEAWLLVERRRLAGVCEAVLRDAARDALAAGHSLEAAALASRALDLNRFDDGAHELLVRCLARAGEVDAAREHVDACEILFRRELRRAPHPGVRRAAEEGGAQRLAGSGDRAAAAGQLDAGRAAVDAGAVEPGVACLRQACAEARAVGDAALLARALAALGSALVHSVRGGDQEGATLLHEALALAEAMGTQEVECRVCRELGYVATQAGHGVSAGRWLARAGGLAHGDRDRAAVLGVRGKALSVPSRNMRELVVRAAMHRARLGEVAPPVDTRCTRAGRPSTRTIRAPVERVRDRQHASSRAGTAGRDPARGHFGDAQRLGRRRRYAHR